MRQNEFPERATAVSHGSGAYTPRRVASRSRGVASGLRVPPRDASAPACSLRGYHTTDVPRTYRSRPQAELSLAEPDVTARSDRQSSTVLGRHWSRSRYKRCFHGNLFQLCCYPLTEHLVSTVPFGSASFPVPFVAPAFIVSLVRAFSNARFRQLFADFPLIHGNPSAGDSRPTVNAFVAARLGEIL